MLDKLKPNLYYNNIFDIDLEELRLEGIRGIICDIDNTIVAWSEEEVLQEVIEWFEILYQSGFKVCLLSNGTDERVRYFSKVLGLPAIGQAVKPTRRAFKLARAKLGLERREIAVIGDQIFTDILGGNRMGFKTILVDPMNEKEFFITRINRFFEKMVFTRRV